MIVVDASVWVGRYVRTDVFHEQSRRWLREMLQRRETLLAPAIFLPELAGSVARRTGQPSYAARVVQEIAAIRSVRLVDIDSTLANQAANIAALASLRGADATYVAVAEAHRIPLVTWDDELRTRTSAMIAAFTPATFPR